MRAFSSAASPARETLQLDLGRGPGASRSSITAALTVTHRRGLSRGALTGRRPRAGLEGRREPAVSLGLPRPQPRSPRGKPAAAAAALPAPGAITAGARPAPPPGASPPAPPPVARPEPPGRSGAARAGLLPRPPQPPLVSGDTCLGSSAAPRRASLAPRPRQPQAGPAPPPPRCVPGAAGSQCGAAGAAPSRPEGCGQEPGPRPDVREPLPRGRWRWHRAPPPAPALPRGAPSLVPGGAGSCGLPAPGGRAGGAGGPGRAGAGGGDAPPLSAALAATGWPRQVQAGRGWAAPRAAATGCRLRGARTGVPGGPPTPHPGPGRRRPRG